MMEVTSIVYVYPRTSRRTKRFWPSLGSIAIVTYNLRGLAHNEKVKMIYRLFRKQTMKGMVQQKGGRKLGDGCFLIPTESLEEALQVLRKHNVRFGVNFKAL
jgi:hypothetical protein